MGNRMITKLLGLFKMPAIDKLLENNFSYHAPVGDQNERYIALRGQAKLLAYRFKDLVPEGRERSLALTKLEEAIFWANAGIARGGTEA